jgi:hypothetical protein
MATEQRTNDGRTGSAPARQRRRTGEDAGARQRRRRDAHQEVPRHEAAPDASGEPEPESPPASRKATVVQSAPYVLGALVLIGYFVWLIMQMSIHASGGSSVPEATFGAVFLGILAGGLAFAHRSRSGG